MRTAHRRAQPAHCDARLMQRLRISLFENGCLIQPEMSNACAEDPLKGLRDRHRGVECDRRRFGQLAQRSVYRPKPRSTLLITPSFTGTSAEIFRAISTAHDGSPLTISISTSETRC